MKANELRIGNLVNSTLLNECRKIDAWALSVIEQGNYQNSHNTTITVFEPIPLTEEWLLKFGFSKSPFDKTSLQYKKDIYSLIGNEENWFCLSVGNFVHTKVRIQYLHQLQNLYFALTGEELTIKTENK